MIRFLARGLLLSWVALLLASCDSGNSSVNVPGVSGYTLTLQLVDPVTGIAVPLVSGQPVTSVSAAAPLRVDATLTMPAPASTPVGGATIQFQVTSGVGRLGTLSAQTNSAGVASVVLNAGTGTGSVTAGTVSASFVDPSFSVSSATVGYKTAGDEVASGGGGGGGPTNVLRLNLLARDGGDGVISPTNPITTLNPGRLIANVTLDGVPVSNALVTFSAPAVASLSQDTVATNGAGIGEVTVNALSNGAGTASATVEYGGQTASASVVLSASVTATSAVTLSLGRLTGSGAPGDAVVFTNAVLGTSATGPLAAGSSITVTADVVQTGTTTAYTTPVTVRFTSSCASLASPTAAIDAQTSTVNGRAQVTYRAQGCTGNDTITATLTDGSSTRTATTTITINAAPVAQLAFVSAAPTNIALAGTGGLGRLTRSEVSFRVLGLDGLPVGNKTVCFALSTRVGGVTVSEKALSSSDGIAIAQVQAGTIPTAVRVQATVDDDTNCAVLPNPSQSAVSDSLTVSTGLPDQDSFSLSMATLNPAAWETDGVAVNVTVRAADHFNNPVPDGTAVSFWSELGSIQPACTTISGACSVVWRSQLPRMNRDPRTPAEMRTAIHDRLGRGTIVAYAVGEESFNDSNGNGRYDNDPDATPPLAETFGDLGEVIKDSNFNGRRDTPAAGTAIGFQSEEFVDFNRSGADEAGNAKYDGVLCATVGTRCSGDATVNVRGFLEMVMSSTDLYMYIMSTVPAGIIDYALDGTVDVRNADGSLAVTQFPTPNSSAAVPTIDFSVVSGTQSVTFFLTDINGNAPPAGTVITAKVEPGAAGVLVGTSSYTVGSNRTNGVFGTFSVRPPTSSPEDGVLTISAKINDVEQSMSVPINY